MTQASEITSPLTPALCHRAITKRVNNGAGKLTTRFAYSEPPRAQLLRRVFCLDALICPRCDTAMIVLALLSEPDVVRKILLHLDCRPTCRRCLSDSE